MNARRIILWIVFISCAIYIAYFFDSQRMSEYDPEPQIKIEDHLSAAQPADEIEKVKILPGVRLPKTTSFSYFVGDLRSSKSLTEKNGDAIFPIASITKLMTALVSVENIDQTSYATVTSSAIKTYGTEGGLSADEKIKVGDLLYPLFFESSNDAAEALAEKTGREKFIEIMNFRARGLGMSSTHFDDPSGLSKNNVSSAKDLFIFATYLYASHPEIIEITRKKKYSTHAENGTKSHTWINRNQYVRDNNVSYLGGKVGYTPEALQTMVSFFNSPIPKGTTTPVAVIVLKSVSRLKDINTLLSYLKNGIVYEREPSRKVSLMFVGDIMLDRGVRASVEKNFKGDYSSLFANTYFLKASNISFGNLEGPASDLGYDLQNLYSFRMDPKVVDAVSKAGFSVLSLANNHAGDWGRRAFEDTLMRLDKANIKFIGGGYYKSDAEKVKIIETNGLKIGYIGFTDVGPKWLTVDDGLPAILSADDPDAPKIIQEASAQVDDLVVSFHFGEEYMASSTARQQELAHMAIDNGARIVVGHHPHTVQEIERYKDGVIAYSLGNFVFDQNFSDETMTGMVLEVLLNGTKIDDVNEGYVKLNSDFQPALVEDYDF
jgi:D-alanyl-D-alanine carboxypeptidase/poly-gamma-glutamate capsule biosynthesis protein CapA/YwtB (metallophosphatase superfamily)